MIEKKRITFDDGRGGRRGRWGVRIKVMRTRGYPKAAAEDAIFYIDPASKNIILVY